MSDTFRPIPGYETAYAISRGGVVLSHERVVNRTDGRTRRIRQRVLRQHHRRGRARVQLSKNGRRSTRYVESLVAETWGHDVRRRKR